MDVYIECPVCEERFPTSGGLSNKQVTCPGCSHSFPFSSVQPVPPRKRRAPSAQTSGLSSAQNSELARLATFTKPGSDSAEPVDLSLEPLIDSPVSSPGGSVVFNQRKQPGTLEIRARYQKRNKRKLMMTLATGAVLAALIGILSGLLVMQLQNNRTASGDPESSLDPGDQPDDSPAGSDNDSPDVRQPTLPNENSNKTVPPPKKIRLKDLPPQKFVFHSKKEIDDCWELVQPHLVSLNVIDGRGPHPATGILVDSRGWIVTSYSGIAGATKIEVTASAKTIDQLPNDQLLQDLVRGVVAIDIEHDLAILSINRRFVVSFADIKIAPPNSVVLGQFLIQSSPPSSTHPYARYESKIEERGRLDELPPAAREEATRRGLTDSKIYWLATQAQPAPVPGTPLVNIDGSLAACFIFESDGLSYFLPVDHLGSLLKTKGTDIQPLSVLGGAGEAPAGDGVAVSHPLREDSVRLNLLADACQRFDWIPKDPDQYKDLQDFGQQVTKLLTYKMETEAAQEKERNPAPNPHLEQVKLQIKQWEDALTQRFSNLNNEDLLALREMNKLARRELKKPMRHVVFFGNVQNLDITGGRHILTVDGTTDISHVNVPFIPQDDPMDLDSEWLFFVRTGIQPQTITFLIGDEKRPTDSAELTFYIGPLN